VKRELKKLIQASVRAEAAWASALGNGPAVETPDGMRHSFIAYRLACAISETEELLSVYNSLWPEERELRVRARRAATGRFASRAELASAAFEVAEEELPEASLARSRDAGDLFAFFCQLRRSILYASGAPDARSFPRESSGAIETALDSVTSLDRSQKAVLQGALEGLTRNSFLFPRARLPDGDSIGERYATLFQAIRLLRGETSMNIDEIREILSDAKVKLETRTRVEDLINDLRKLLSDFDIERIWEDLAEGGFLFPGLGEGGDIVVIPGHGQASCAPIVLAIAKGRDGRSRFGLPNVMREVRAHLIQCFEIAEVVILLTDRWDPDLMRESEPDFSAYASRPIGRKVLIPLVSWKRQLTTYAWP